AARRLPERTRSDVRPPEERRIPVCRAFPILGAVRPPAHHGHLRLPVRRRTEIDFQTPKSPNIPPLPGRATHETRHSERGDPLRAHMEVCRGVNSVCAAGRVASVDPARRLTACPQSCPPASADMASFCAPNACALALAFAQNHS